MKIKPEHYAAIVNALRTLRAAQPLLTPAVYQEKHIGKDPAKRFRWDAFTAARINGGSARWLCDNVYSYADDTHIDTALRRAVAEVYS